MAAAPYRVAPEVSPTGGAQPLTGINVSAEDTGAVSAAGLQRLGYGLTKAADVFDDLAAQDVGNQYEEMATKLLYGDPNKMVDGPDGPTPDTGYFGKRGADALNARADTERRLQEFQKEASGKLLTLPQKQAFDKFANSYRMQARARISNFADSQATTYGEKVNEATAKIEFDKIAAFPEDVATVEGALHRVRSAYVKSAQLRGGGPELISQAMRAADRDVVKAQVFSVAVTDPEKALRIAKNNQKTLGVEYDNVYLTLLPRADFELGRNFVRRQIYGDGEPIPAGADAKELLRRFEGRILKAKEDRSPGAPTAFRVGYGSDTVTRADGTQERVTPSTVITEEDAERDLEKRSAVSMGQVRKAAGDAWEKLDGPTRAALTSVAYNYGNVPDRIVGAIRTGDREKIAEAVRGLQNDNEGINRGRRNKEADFILGRAGTTHPVAPSEVGLIDAINNDPVFKDRPRAKEIALAEANKQVSQFNSDRSAQIKSLNDTLEATTLMMQLDPTNYKSGTLMGIAEGFRRAGDLSAYANAVFLAQNEEVIKTLATSQKSAQNRIISGMLTGKAKALAEGLIAASKEEATEAGRIARDEFSAIKEAVEGKSQIPIASLEKKIRDTMGLAVRSQDPLLPGQIADFVEAARAGSVLSQLGPVQQEDLMRELRDKVVRGQTTNTDLTRLNFLTKMSDQQDAAFKDDALKAGVKLYNLPMQPINWAGNEGAVADMLGRRAFLSNQISANRDGMQVSIVTNEEMDGLRNMLKTATPQKAESLFRVLSGMPDDKKAHFAALLAGKNNTGDFLTNSYGASLSLFSSADPEDKAAASKILRGATIRKNMGTKAPPVESAAWGSALQDTLGNVFKDTGATVPDTIKDAIASVYTHDMFMAGKIGEAAPDIDMLNSAIKQVVGEPRTRNGQKFFPPVRGMTTYDVDKALSTMTDGDVPNLRTTEGKPVTADDIRRNAQFSNVQDGRYMVRIPDGRNGIPSEILDYSSGEPKAYILDMRPLVERARFGAVEGSMDPRTNPSLGRPPVQTLMGRGDYSKPR